MRYGFVFPTIDSVGGESDEAYIWNYRNGTWTIRTLNSVIRGDVAPVPGGGVPSAVITFSGDTGTNGIARIGSYEVQSFDLATDASVGQIDDPVQERRTLAVADSFESGTTTVNRQELRASAPPLIETTIAERFYAGPNNTRAEWHVELPTGTFSSNTATDGSPEELQFGGAKLEFEYAAGDTTNPDSQRRIVVSANQLYDAAGVAITGDGTGDTDGEYQDTGIEIDSLQIPAGGETITGDQTAASGSNPHTFNNVTYTSSNTTAITGTGTATTIDGTLSGTNVVTATDATSAFSFSANGTGSTTTNYLPINSGLNNIVVAATDETQDARSFNVNQGTGTTAFGSRQTSYTGSVAVTDSGSFPFRAPSSGSTSSGTAISTFTQTGQVNGSVSANIVSGTRTTTTNVPGQTVTLNGGTTNRRFGNRDVFPSVPAGTSIVIAGTTVTGPVTLTGLQTAQLLGDPTNSNPNSFGLISAFMTTRGNPRPPVNGQYSIRPTGTFDASFRAGENVQRWAMGIRFFGNVSGRFRYTSIFYDGTSTNAYFRRYVGIQGTRSDNDGNPVGFGPISWSQGEPIPNVNDFSDVSNIIVGGVTSSTTTTVNTRTLSNVTNNTNGTITFDWAGANISVPAGQSRNSGAVDSSDSSWSASGSAAGRRFTNNTSYPLNFTGGGVTLPAIPIGQSQTAATRNSNWSSTISVAASPARSFQVTNNNTEYPITFTPSGSSTALTVPAGMSRNTGVRADNANLQWAASGQARQLTFTNTGGFPIANFRVTPQGIVDTNFIANEATTQSTRVRSWSGTVRGTTVTNSNTNGSITITHEAQGDSSTTSTVNPNGGTAFFVNTANAFSYTGTRFFNNRTLNQTYNTRTGAAGVTTTGTNPITFTNSTGFTLYYFNPGGTGVDNDNPHLANGATREVATSSTNWTARDIRPAAAQFVVSAIKNSGEPVDNFNLDVTSNGGETIQFDDAAPFSSGDIESVTFNGTPSSYTWRFTGDQRLVGTSPAPTPRNAVPTTDFAARFAAAVNAGEIPQLTDWVAVVLLGTSTVSLRSTIPGERNFNTTSGNFERYTGRPTTITTGDVTGTQIIRDNNNLELFTVTVTGTEAPYTYVVSTSRNTGFYDSDTIRHLEIRSGGVSYNAPAIEFNRSSEAFTFTSSSNIWTVVEAPETPVPTYVRLLNGVLDETGTELGTTGITRQTAGVGLINTPTVTRVPLRYQFNVNFVDDSIDDINFVYQWPEDTTPPSGIDNEDAINLLVAALRTGVATTPATDGTIITNEGFANINQYFRVIDHDGVEVNGMTINSNDDLLRNQFDIEARGFEGQTGVTFGDGTTGTFPMLTVLSEHITNDDDFGGVSATTFGSRTNGASGVRPPVVSGVTGFVTSTPAGGFAPVSGSQIPYAYSIVGTHSAGPEGAASIAAIVDEAYSNFRNQDDSLIWRATQGTTTSGANRNDNTVAIQSTTNNPHENTITVMDPDNGLTTDGTNSVQFFTQRIDARGVRSLAPDTVQYPVLTMTSPENQMTMIELDASGGDLNAAAIVDLIEGHFRAPDTPIDGWDVQVTGDTVNQPWGTAPTTATRFKLHRTDTNAVTPGDVWEFSIDYGNTGTTFPTTVQGAPHTISADQFNQVESGNNFIFAGGPPILATPTYVMVRISNASITGGVQYIPFVFGNDATYNEITQVGNQGTQVDATTAVGRIVSGIEAVNRRVAIERAGDRLSILPSQYSELANFVLGLTTNETVEGVTEWNRLVVQNPDQLDPVTWMINPVNGTQGVHSIPDPINLDTPNRREPNDTQAVPIDNRRPDRTERTVPPSFSTGDPVVNTTFDPLRPWPTSQVNLNREFPIFATSILTGTLDLQQNFRGADIGFLFLGQPYESFVERIELAITPEFDTEQLQALALWGDGGTATTFGQAIEQAILDVKMYGTNSPGETRGVFNNAVRGSMTTPVERQRTTTNNFRIGEDYKIDMRIHGRFLNLLISDFARPEDGSAPTSLNTAGVSWNLSGMQADIFKGGRR